MHKNIRKTALKEVFVFLCRYGFSRLSEAKYMLAAAFLLVGFLYPLPADITLADFEPKMPVNALTTAQTALVSAPGLKPAPLAVKKVYVTAYSSTPEETDDTPFITAAGKEVRDGIVASNFLAMGTRIRIPAVFGDKVFIVEDRMHPRITNVVDVWMPSKDEAIQFGRKYVEIEILET